MGGSGDGYGSSLGDGIPEESVTDVGGPVLLAATAPDLRRGDVLAGRYQIEALLGSGGSGRVLRAFDRVAKTPVALKILRREFAVDPVWTERFSRELRVGRQIQDPHVCRVFDIGEADGHRFLSMELATGGTIRAQIAKDAPPRSLDERVADARAVIEGVAALHGAGIVHRDIKPENILRMGDGRLVVSDFGLATDPGSGPTSTVMVGTPTYMAPEVVMGDPATMRADVWALGVVLHEIFFARRPDRSTAPRGRRRYTLPEVAEVKERRVAELCGRCSDDVPEMRPTSAVEVLREFQLALQGRRRFDPGTARKRQLMWGAVALAALGSLGLIRNRWVNRAAASSSQVASSMDNRVLQPTGTPQDWGKGSTKLASFAGRLHCFSLIDGGKKVRAIWGTPRKAEDIDVKSGARTPSSLLASTYQDDCPQTSPNGKNLLFEKASETGPHISLSPFPDGRDAKEIVRGAAPEWLPNGQEFVFELDSRHAALFSLPTGEMTVVGDGVTSSRQLAEKALDPSGTRLAIRYFTDTVNNLVVIQALRTLEMERSFLVPPSASRLQFSPSKNDRVLLALDGIDGFSQMASVDWHAPVLTAVGGIAGADIRGILDMGGATIVVSRKLRRNLWLDAGDGSSKQLTYDGESYAGSVSPQGDLVVHRRLPNGRYVIVLRRSGGQEEQVTTGPLDMSPMFFPDGKKWLYVSYSSHELIECRVLDNLCAPIHGDPLMPIAPTIDPSGRQVAYLTAMSGPRLHLWSLGAGTDRDLGPVSFGGCTPIWASEARLWVVRTMGHESVWAEINTASGERTGKVVSGKVRSDRECNVPEGIFEGSRQPPPRVSAVSEETSEFVRRDGAI